jgi:PAS domain S-box-containing protein
MISAIHEGFMLIDRNMTIREVNEGYLKEYGWDRDDVIGRHCYEISHGREEPCSSSEHPCPAKEVFRTGKPVRVEHVHKDKQGHDISVEVRAFPLPDGNGNVERVVEVHHNITETKRAEEERSSRERFQAALETAGSMCHELNQPLQLISLHTELLTTELAEIHSAGSRLNEIVRQVDRITKVIRRLQNITEYKSRPYVEGTRILDIHNG